MIVLFLFNFYNNYNKYMNKTIIKDKRYEKYNNRIF